MAEIYRKCSWVACSKALGWRFGSQLDVAVPLVVRYCEVVGNAEDEFRENCLQVSPPKLVLCSCIVHPRSAFLW